MVIHWYPGHMAKAKRLLAENLKLVDVVIELLDARIPASSRNPQMQTLIANKPRVVALTKIDLADPGMTAAWQTFFHRNGIAVVGINAATGQGLPELINATREAAAAKLAALAARGRRERPVRAMIVGIPNVGKSSLINRLAGARKARTGDRPGVTRAKQWIKVGANFELLDTPGILWPKLDDPDTAFKLAVTGAIPEAVLDIMDIIRKLLVYLVDNRPQVLRERYKLVEFPADTDELLRLIGARRGFFRPGGVVDVEKTAHVVLDEFRDGKLGPVTFDRPPNNPG